MCTHGLNCFKVLWLLKEKINMLLTAFGWLKRTKRPVKELCSLLTTLEWSMAAFLSLVSFHHVRPSMAAAGFQGPLSSEWTPRALLSLSDTISKNKDIPLLLSNCRTHIGIFIPAMLSKYFCLKTYSSARWPNSMQPSLVDFIYLQARIWLPNIFTMGSMSAWSCFKYGFPSSQSMETTSE